jgi:pyruvate dehydrogenase E2 component (dihydrolipoamide acetyltransferase)
MNYEFFLPDLGEGVTEAEIIEWLIEVGQDVSEDQPMVEVQTDKATVEIACPVDGVVAALHAAPGDRVAVGSPLVSFVEEERERTAAQPAGDRAAAAVAPAPSPPRAGGDGSARVRATPAARRLAHEVGVALASVTGTGPEGAITDRDVRAAAGAGSPKTDGATAGRREPLRGVRRRIAERLTVSHQQIPMVTVVEECDFTELAARRGEISYTAFVVRAAVSGLRAFPDFNATLDGEEIVYHERYDIGIATQGPEGLLVPVLKGADSRSLEEVDEEVDRLASRVRAGTVSPEELRGGTFTLTLAGKLGGLFATPLVNPGEAAILGVHRIAARPVVREDQIVIRQIGLVSCSFDHRITDGTRATMFLLHVIGELQSE